jgi:starch synthase
MKLLYAASEAVPFVKTGGLADVAGSLPAALQACGADVRVILPLYRTIAAQFKEQMTFLFHFTISLSWRTLYCGLFSLERDGILYYFVDNEAYFRRGEPYGYFDDGERFGYFCRAVVEAIPKLGWMPDIVHCNDWHTALIPIYLREESKETHSLASIRTIFTIHNVEYQGRFGRETLEDLFGLPAVWYDSGILEYYGGISLMKGAVLVSDLVTTVSPTYAQELHYDFYAHGMAGILAANEQKLHGILNGIDTERYNPATDPVLCQTYTAQDCSGKHRCKQELQALLGLPQNPESPIIACVSRLASHKGFDLIQAVLPEIMALPVQFVLLGRGEWHLEHFFEEAQHQYPGRFSANLFYDETLATKIYAGADLFLMPSKSEPCGLAQMIAMRYGTLPVVRETGGLKDTVSPYQEQTGEGNGFTFTNYNAHDMLFMIQKAVSLYQSPSLWHMLMQRGMEKDFSWGASAAQYYHLASQLILS